MKREGYKMELEVEAKIKEEGTGLCTMWVWEKRQWALMYILCQSMI